MLNWCEETRAAERILGAKAMDNQGLESWCTYRVGGPAALFMVIESFDDLTLLARAVQTTNVNVLLVGKGSNLLVSDNGFDGVVVHLDGGFGAIEVDENVVTAGAAVMLPVLARQTARAGLTGLEWAVGVPGTVGGAVRMNAGGHGSDIAKRLLDAEVFNLGDGSIQTVVAANLDLGYRSSSIMAEQIVLSARFGLDPGDAATANAQISTIVAWRRQNQPGGQNAGSVFANPDGESAGKLIDDAGLKGYRLGSARISDKHANFILVDPGGKAQDVFLLIQEIRSRILETHGITLRVENQLVGFAPDIKMIQATCSIGTTAERPTDITLRPPNESPNE